MADKVRKKMISDALVNWITLNEKISEFTEEEVLYALELENEREDGPRPTFLARLDQRFRGVKIEELREELNR